MKAKIAKVEQTKSVAAQGQDHRPQGCIEANAHRALNISHYLATDKFFVVEFSPCPR